MARLSPFDSIVALCRVPFHRIVHPYERRSVASSRRSRTRKQAHFTNTLSNRELLAGNNAFVAVKVDPRRYFNRHFAIVIQLVHFNHLQRRIGL